MRVQAQPGIGKLCHVGPADDDCADDDGSWVMGEKATHRPADDAPTPMAHATVRDRFMALLGRVVMRRIEVRYQYDQRSRALMCCS